MLTFTLLAHEIVGREQRVLISRVALSLHSSGAFCPQAATASAMNAQSTGESLGLHATAGPAGLPRVATPDKQVKKSASHSHASRGWAGGRRHMARACPSSSARAGWLNDRPQFFPRGVHPRAPPAPPALVAPRSCDARGGRDTDTDGSAMATLASPVSLGSAGGRKKLAAQRRSPSYVARRRRSVAPAASVSKAPLDLFKGFQSLFGQSMGGGGSKNKMREARKVRGQAEGRGRWPGVTAVLFLVAGR